MAFTLIGLDGIEIPFAEAFKPCGGTSHGLHTTSGYIVRKTYWPGQNRAHEDVAQFGRSEYGEALQSVHAVRAAQAKAITRHTPADDGTKGYGVIDTLYACGCRGMA